jgi:hypothetical protein
MQLAIPLPGPKPERWWQLQHPSIQARCAHSEEIKGFAYSKGAAEKDSRKCGDEDYVYLSEWEEGGGLVSGIGRSRRWYSGLVLVTNSIECR